MNFLEKPEKIRQVYLDHSATTYVLPEVYEVMQPYFMKKYGNPSSIYSFGRQANQSISESRKQIAQILNCQPNSIIFTGSGTESDNMAIFGIAKQYQNQGKHIITTKVEHKAVLEPIKELSKQGFEITYLDVDEFGQIDLNQLEKSIKPETILISVMMANNEIGTVYPVADIGRIILKYRKKHNTNLPFFHSDACQAANSFNLDVEKLHVDLLTINAGKIYGPKGIGLLYIRPQVKIKPIILGGQQEFGLRAGTENVANIVGFAKALNLVQSNFEQENKRLFELRNKLWLGLKEKIDNIYLNGPELTKINSRLVNNLSVSFMNVEGEAILLYLDEFGIMVSTGSACNSGSLSASHVLLACGLDYQRANTTIRFSLGKVNNQEDIDYVLKYLPEIIKKLRLISSVK